MPATRRKRMLDWQALAGGPLKVKAMFSAQGACCMVHARRFHLLPAMASGSAGRAAVTCVRLSHGTGNSWQRRRWRSWLGRTPKRRGSDPPGEGGEGRRQKESRHGAGSTGTGENVRRSAMPGARWPGGAGEAPPGGCRRARIAAAAPAGGARAGWDPVRCCVRGHAWGTCGSGGLAARRSCSSRGRGVPPAPDAPAGFPACGRCPACGDTGAICLPGCGGHVEKPRRPDDGFTQCAAAHKNCCSGA